MSLVQPLATKWPCLRVPSESVLASSVGSGLIEQVAAASPTRPVLPRPLGLRRSRLVARVAGVDLAARQRLHLAERERREQRAGVARRGYGHPHDLDERTGGGGEAVAAHQRRVVSA